MRNLLLFLVFILLLSVSCSRKQSLAKPDFNAFKERFVRAWWKLNPVSATGAGFHQYDSLLPAYTEETRNRERAFARTYLDSLSVFDVAGLDELNRIDHSLMSNLLRASLFYVDTFKAWQWDPSSYNVADAFAGIINARNLDPGTKYDFIIARLRQVPQYYKAALLNKRSPTMEHDMLAREQLKGAITYLDKEVKSFCSIQEPERKQSEYTALIDEAIRSIHFYIDDLVSSKYEERPDFRIGKELYERKFAFDIQSALSAEQLYQKALHRKSELHAEMYSITQKLWSKYFKESLPQDSLKAIRMMIDKVSLKHAHRDSFMQEIEKQIPELTAFVKEKNLLYLDPSKPLKVRRTPAYKDGVAGASIDAPGPYDSNAETYYNVSTLEKKTPEQAESYLREYNHYVLQVLNIHEAIPGHYAQLVYANKAPSVIKTIFGNGAMVEGWAVYGERMMLENGYGASASSATGPNPVPESEMQLMYDKWHLRTVCNTILDYSVHVLGWEEKQAMHLLMDEAFQQEAEAGGKWKRVGVTQVQLCCYFSGYSEIYDLREELKRKPGFDLKVFHEQFLSYGNSPVRHIREMMLKK